MNALFLRSLRFRRSLTYLEWKAEAERRFGPDPMKWRFVCPSCGHIASTMCWKLAGATQGEVAFSCVGRHRDGAKEAFAGGDNSKGCTYAGGGLIKLNPVTVTSDGKSTELFEFAPEEP